MVGVEYGNSKARVTYY